MKLPLITLPLFALSGMSPLLAQAPNTLPGLQLWLDAQDGSTISTSGGQVTQWDDKSGNGFHAVQGDAARQPTVAGSINGFSAIHLDATGAGDPNSDALAVSTLNIAAHPYTVFIVDQYWGATQGRTLQGAGANWLIGKWGGRNAHFTGEWAGPFGAQTFAGTNAPVVTEGVGGTYNSYQTRNGVTVGHNNVGGSPGGLAIGGAGGGAFDEPSQADVGEVIVYNRVLADNERRQVSNYLAAKWGTATPFQRQYAAQTVRFSGADAGEGLDFSGNFVAAVNAAGGAVTIGDANFAADSGQINSVNSVPGGWGGWNMGPSSDDAALNTVLNSIRWTPAAPGDLVSSTVNGLTPGNTYKVQLIFGEGCCANRHFGVAFDGQDYIRDFQEGATQNGVNNAGTAVVYQFVANSNSMTFSLRSPESGGGDLNPVLNGFTVEDRGITGTKGGGVITSAASIDTTGVFAYALDFGNSSSLNGPGSKVVNGLTFSPAEGASGAYTFAENNIPYHFVDIGSSASDNALEDILHTIRWEETASEGEVVAIDLNVNSGQQYKLTMLFADSNALNREFDINIDGVRVWDNFRVSSLGGDAAYLTYEFTAGDNQLNLMLDGFTTSIFNVPPGDDNPIISGLMLEVVPEPGSVALAGLSACALLMRRRRA